MKVLILTGYEDLFEVFPILKGNPFIEQAQQVIREEISRVFRNQVKLEFYKDNSGFSAEIIFEDEDVDRCDGELHIIAHSHFLIGCIFARQNFADKLWAITHGSSCPEPPAEFWESKSMTADEAEEILRSNSYQWEGGKGKRWPLSFSANRIGCE